MGKQENGHSDDDTAGEKSGTASARHVGQRGTGAEHRQPDHQKWQGQQLVEMKTMFDRREAGTFQQIVKSRQRHKRNGAWRLA